MSAWETGEALWKGTPYEIVAGRCQKLESPTMIVQSGDYVSSRYFCYGAADANKAEEAARKNDSC